MTSAQIRGDVHLFRTYDECQTLREEWDALLSRQCAGIDQLDLTAGFDWVMALWQSHLQGLEQHVFVLRDGAHISGILPVYRFQKSVRGISCRSLAPMTQIYGGRTGFLLRELELNSLEALLGCLSRLQDPWDLFLATVVKGSAYERLLLDLASQKRWHFVLLSEERSPFIPFQNSWEQHFASLPKKLRSTMRNGEKRLREKGELTYQECRSLDEVATFNSAVEFIERDSWKASAGTSIGSNAVHEAFHRNLALRAAKRERFSGHLLFLNGEPIAYIMGLLYGGVFLDLKESYRMSFREMSPGHVLKYFAFGRLYDRGTRLYDFMGRCEEYKLKWTDQTYSRSTYIVFNRTMRARAARLASSVYKRRVSEGPQPSGSQARQATQD